MRFFSLFRLSVCVCVLYRSYVHFLKRPSLFHIFESLTTSSVFLACFFLSFFLFFSPSLLLVYLRAVMLEERETSLLVVNAWKRRVEVLNELGLCSQHTLSSLHTHSTQELLACGISKLCRKKNIIQKFFSFSRRILPPNSLFGEIVLASKA